MNKEKLSQYLFFLILYFISIILFYLSKNNFFPVAHGPFYFSFAESLYNGLGLYSYWTIPQDEGLVYTFQMGVSFIMYLSLLVFKKTAWFYIFYLFSTVLWFLAFKQIKFFLKKINFKSPEIYLFFILVFFQPYNLNQIATFSNEVIYYPVLIFSFFLLINYFDDNSFKIKNYESIILILTFVFGIFFRFHHVVFLSTVGIYIVFFKRDLILKYILISSISLILFIFIIFNTTLINSLAMAQSIFTTSLDNFNFLNIFENLNNTKKDLNIGMGYVKDNDYLFVTLVRLTDIFTYPILLQKFSSSILIKFFMAMIFLFLNIGGLIILKNKAKNFYYLSIIFTILSLVFLIFLPFFELSYVLPLGFIFILNILIFLKTILKDYYLKILIPIFVTFILVIVFAYTGFYKNKIIEVYGNRQLTEDVKNFYKEYPFKENLYYATSDVYYTYELHYWHGGSRICLVSISIEECQKLRGIKKFKNVIFLFNKDTLVLEDQIYQNFLEENKFEINNEINKRFISFYIKRN